MVAIKEFPKPANITNLRSFLGLAQQFSKYTSQLSKEIEPFRDLLSEKNEWLWLPENDIAFGKVKDLLCSPLVLSCYDLKKETLLRVDASKLHGIGVVVYQKQSDGEWRPIDCASRLLSQAERNYWPIELEMLAVSWGY